jgi:hypothetical protein
MGLLGLAEATRLAKANLYYCTNLTVEIALLIIIKLILILIMNEFFLDPGTNKNSEDNSVKINNFKVDDFDFTAVRPPQMQ